MATPENPTGRVIHNPISGERIVIRRSGDETGGEVLCFDLYLPPGVHVPAGHTHPGQEERFTVISGQMRFRLGRHTVMAHPGDTVVVPVGAAHWFGNPGSELAHAQVEARPALRLEEFFVATEALAARRRFRGTRLPAPASLAQMLSEFREEVGVPHVPAPLLHVLLAPLAWHSRRRSRRE
jgi:quercetin dioxygenase-like cupin family protein